MFICKKRCKFEIAIVDKKHMKKLLLFFLFLYKSTLLGQTVLNTFPLDLKKYDQNNQILNVKNSLTHELFVFATSATNLSILQYNSALFLKNDVTIPRTNLGNKSIIGYSFSEDGNPTLYWSTEDYKSIIVIKYFLESKTYKALSFTFPSENQYIITSFQENDSFYLLSNDITQNGLLVYAFKNGTAEEKLFDFSTYTFQDKRTKPLTFNQLINQDPIEKIDPSDYTPLDQSTKKSKVYLLNHHILLTLDHNPKETLVFDLNLESDQLTARSYPQSGLIGSKKQSNSFLCDDRLYQLNATDEALVFDIKDYTTGQTIKSYKVSNNDSIRFKSSPMWSQRDDLKPKEIKKTSKFLQSLSFSDIGLSVFKSQQNTLITLGGIPKIEKIYSSFNDDSFGWDFASPFHTETVFFETNLDLKAEFNSYVQPPMALDNIHYFLDFNKKAILPSIVSFKNYSILGYYDTALKQYTMRKFTNGFMQEEAQNPIISKAIFSKDFPMDKP
jgi:hypothetical protein